MPGASDEARRVKILNANWVAGADGEDGRFELMIVTSDDGQHVVSVIAANLRGTMPWTEEEPTRANSRSSWNSPRTRALHMSSNG